MAKYKIGDVFRIKGDKELNIITISQDIKDKTYGFEKLLNRAIHGDVDEDLIMRVKRKVMRK